MISGIDNPFVREGQVPSAPRRTAVRQCKVEHGLMIVQLVDKCVKRTHSD